MRGALRLVLVMGALIGVIDRSIAQGLPSGVFTLTIKYLSGQHQDCERFNGSAEAVVEDGNVKSTLVRSLRIGLEPDGVVTGFGYESVTGHGAAMHLKGKQTPTGFAGTAGLERWGYMCSIGWSLVGPGAVSSKPAP
jgi:hypothetical protein